jgi:DNA-binding winged helix-turn-helix (wHTH) protein
VTAISLGYLKTSSASTFDCSWAMTPLNEVRQNSLGRMYLIRGLERLLSLDRIFRFGKFEADRERHQLTCSGRRIKLERIPLELLFLLLEEQGRVVTREQIVTRLWGNDLVLDTERSINTAVRKLRRALGDDARQPDFIETLVGKGYCFLPSNAEGDEDLAFHPERPLSSLVTGTRDPSGESSEIRLTDFRIEPAGGAALLSCSIVRAHRVIGRMPFARLELPDRMSMPLQPEDKLLMKLLGVRVKLTPDATRALQAFCIQFLQNLSTTQLARSAVVAEPPESRTDGSERLGTWAGGTSPE